jgi:hypothetical protein
MPIAAQTELRWRTVLAFAEFPLRLLLFKFDEAVAAGRTRMQISVCLQRIIIGMALMLFWFVSAAHAEMASVYGDPTVIAEVAQPMGSE